MSRGACHVNKLKIANEAATGITKAGVVYIRCLELDITGVRVFFGFSDFRVQILQGGDGQPEQLRDTMRSTRNLSQRNVALVLNTPCSGKDGRTCQ